MNFFPQLSPLLNAGDDPGVVPPILRGGVDPSGPNAGALIMPPAPPIPTSPSVALQRPNLLSRIFGGGNAVGGPTGNQAGFDALTNAGLAMLQASGPSPVRASLGQVLAAGLGTGRQSYAQALEGQRQKLLQTQRQAIQQKYQGKTDLGSLQSMLGDLVAIGDYEGAKPLAGYLESAIKAVGGKDSLPNLDHVVRSNIDGTKTQVWYDPKTGAVVKEEPFGAVDKDPALEAARRAEAGQQRQAASTIIREFREQTKPQQLAAEAYQQFREAVAQHDNPASFFAALDNFARIQNPGAIVRPTTMEIIRSMGSWPTQVETWINNGMKGVPPKEVYDRMDRLVRAQIMRHASDYNEYRDAAMAQAQLYGLEPNTFTKALPNAYKKLMNSGPVGNAKTVEDLVGTP